MVIDLRLNIDMKNIVITVYYAVISMVIHRITFRKHFLCWYGVKKCDETYNWQDAYSVGVSDYNRPAFS